MVHRGLSTVLLTFVGLTFHAPVSSGETVQRQAGEGVIAGIVVNERQEPVRGARVVLFSVGARVPEAQPHGAGPFEGKGSGSTVTDAAGTFRIGKLPLGDYLVAATSGGLVTRPAGTPVYGITFFPSTLDVQQAAPVSVLGSVDTTVRIQLIPVQPVRVSGSVTSPTGQPVGGLAISLYRGFGGFGAGATVGTVDAKGTFEIAGIVPGQYWLTIQPPPSSGTAGRGGFAGRTIDVRDRDLKVALVLAPGGLLVGRVLLDASTNLPSPLGLRVEAWPVDGQAVPSGPITQSAAADGSFRLSGLFGTYHLLVRSDSGLVAAARLTVDGQDVPLEGSVDLADGGHTAVIVVAAHQPAPMPVDTTLSTSALVEQFKSEGASWRQFDIGKAIVARHDPRALPLLVDWLGHEDRHIRGNVAFVFAGLGDSRGWSVIIDMLSDRSDRPLGQGTPAGPSDGRYHVAAQIKADRYYAAHLLGDLHDRRAVPTLIPLLNDPDIQSIVPWALGEIGDRSAIPPLLDVLDRDDPTMRVLAIYALETLNAREALPRLRALLDDHRTTNFGAQVSVADAAEVAILKLK